MRPVMCSLLRSIGSTSTTLNSRKLLDNQSANAFVCFDCRQFGTRGFLTLGVLRRSKGHEPKSLLLSMNASNTSHNCTIEPGHSILCTVLFS